MRGVVTATLAGVLAAACAIASCGGTASSPSGSADSGAPDAQGDATSGVGPIAIPSSPQRSGDPAKGYAALVNEGYVGCGIPYSAYSKVFGPAPAAQKLPGRNAANADIPYNYTRFTTASGIDVVGPNCFTCHAAPMQGTLIAGLGDSAADFTVDYATEASLAQILVTDPAEKAELAVFLDRVTAVSPYILTSSIGITPSDNIAAVLFAHRDVKTLAWNDTPYFALPPKIAVPVDVPPWWRMGKKNAMFYTAAGRGDHARIMMAASTFCVDAVDQARAIDAYFPDVRAWIVALTPPKFPFPIDQALADKGKPVFESTCARCHGTYGASPSYPNFVIPLADVATDPILAAGAAQFAGPSQDWFNASFYGEIAHLDTQKGYYAPPLDGIWATAPYLHNGSVPTLAALLDSTTRPQFFIRTFDSNDYDAAAVGWHFTASATGQASEPNATKKKHLYDTTQLGYSNAGHTYGDALSATDRAAVIEYLKTL